MAYHGDTVYHDAAETRPYAGVTVVVRNGAAPQDLASITDTLGNPILGSQITTSALGFYEFNAASGPYLLQFLVNGAIKRDQNIVIGLEDAAAIDFLQAGTGATTRSAQAKLRDLYHAKDYGALGDGVTDDTAALKAVLAACPPHGRIDLGNGTYRITQSLGRPNVAVSVTNGKILLDNAALTPFYAFTANDDCVFDSVQIFGTGAIGNASAPKYQGGIFGGNTDYPAPMNTTPASHVHVRDCHFENLTVGIFVGGATGDPLARGWIVGNNTFANIVGYRGQSEGYGIVFSPTSSCKAIGNKLASLARHGIYLASGSSYNIIDSNTIDGVDNLAIQMNVFQGQGTATGNRITNNVLSGFTRSIAYGYRSSIGIGLYGDQFGTVVSGNTILDPLDTGIDTARGANSTQTGPNPASVNIDLIITNNYIRMAPAATDAAVRLDDMPSGRVSSNRILLQGAIYGVVTTGTVTAATDLIDLSDNMISTTNSSAVGFRLAWTIQRIARVFKNTLYGFPSYAQRLSDTSTVGVRRTDLNCDLGTFGNDADVTHTSGGTAPNVDCPRLLDTATLTANRGLYLSKIALQPGALVRVSRNGTDGGFSRGIYNGDPGASPSLLVSMTNGQFYEFASNGTDWVRVA